MKSIQEVSEELETSHRKYIEANYHLHHPRLLRERRELMHDGEIATEPWVEASPTYETGKHFEDLNIPSSLIDLLNNLKEDEDGPKVYDPPYLHQARGLEAFFDREKDLVVSTGTGSGKTEIFLYSILGQLAQEAERGKSTDQRGIRTLILYPMNALVADQLARMRLLFGNDVAANDLQDRFDRTIQFGMYTSRTPYHGEYNADRNTRQIAPIIDTYLELQENNEDLYEDLMNKGRVPAKDLEGFRNKYHDRETQFRTQPGDTELFTRQEMYDPDNDHGGTPDLLITNYSMLEYMLLRPIEQTLFEDTKEWLAADEENELLMVLDEAHLYRGAQGAEVSLLLNRLFQKLDIPRSRVRFILTSATMGGDTEVEAPNFAAQLTSSDPSKFEVVEGNQISFGSGAPGDVNDANALVNIGYTVEDNDVAIRNLSSVREWDSLDTAGDNIERYLAEQLEDDSIFQLAHTTLQEDAQPLQELAPTLFDVSDPELAEEATGNLLYLSTVAERSNGTSLLSNRLHMMLKGLPAQYACVNPECSERQVKDPDNPLLGHLYTSPRTTCDCGCRVYELMSHRTCGAAYLKAFRQKNDRSEHTFLWSETDSKEELEEIHILLEEPRTDEDPKHPEGIPLSARTPSRYLDCSTGHLVKSPKDGDGTYIKVWVPGEEQRPTKVGLPWSWTRCPACGIKERRTRQGETQIMDLVTKGEEPFANIIRSMFEFQPEDPEKKGKYPNAGKKLLCFSDGRQKAARLARDLQRSVELDSFREVIADIMHDNPDLSMDQLFAAFTVYCKDKHIVFFDDEDQYNTQEGDGYDGSRTHFEQLQKDTEDIKDSFWLEDVEEIVHVEDACEALSNNRPKQYDSMLLRALGHKYYSISATLVGYLRPVDQVMDAIKEENPGIDPDIVEAVTIEALRDACEERDFDPDIQPRQRRDSETYPTIKEKDVGMAPPEIIPEHLKEALSDKVAEDEWDTLARSFIRSKMSASLFKSVGDMRFVINPKATTIELALEEGWYRCEGCRRFSVIELDGKCPHMLSKNDNVECQGTLRELEHDDLYIEAKTDFVRDPPRRVVQEEAEPFTLRSEEHSAQLNAKDFGDTFSKAEEYELLFQDILVGDNESEQPVDVLSCTTTMEVGIDIGSLTGVAMRTVPPRPENYEQRAGRAGRRGAGLSTIVTFADNSAHESYYFNRPEKMIGAESSKPIIYAGNKKIAERHINASLIARFFGPADREENANVFESLGTAAEFFQDEEEKYSYTNFKDWITTDVLSNGSDDATEIARLLPDELNEDEGLDWAVGFVQDTAETLIEELDELEQVDWSTEDEEKTLLNTLLDDALLPTFSFPIDVCDFIVPGLDRSGIPKTEYEMSYDLKQALSAFIPGRQIVVDKKTFTSYGLYFRFADHPVDRASGEDWDSLDPVHYCPSCDSIFERDQTASSEDLECNVCNVALESRQMFEPPAFAPEIEGWNAKEGERWEEDRIYPTTPKYPLTSKSDGGDDSPEVSSEVSGGESVVERLADQQLMVVNFGEDRNGFEVCTKCGAIDREGGLSPGHNRPYPRDKRFSDDYDWPNTCDGSPIQTTFGHKFPSDLTVLRIPVADPVKWETDTEWFEMAAQSLSEALVLGAAQALNIDSGELEGGFRMRKASSEEGGVTGYIEIFLFDTTPGGAGFASRTFDAFDETLAQAKEVLTDCDAECHSACHNCLMNYQNRRFHDILDRHLGAALLEVVETNQPPELEPGRVHYLMNQLKQTLELKHSDIEFEKYSSEPDAWKISLNGNELNAGVRSCLKKEDFSIAGGIDEHISDFELQRQLPHVAGRISNRLQ